jgi:hypothetical protein
MSFVFPVNIKVQLRTLILFKQNVGAQFCIKRVIVRPFNVFSETNAKFPLLDMSQSSRDVGGSCMSSTLQESTTSTGTKPVAQAFRFLQHFIPFIIVHQPSSEAHISCMIPDPQIFLFRFLCSNTVLIDKSRTSTFLLKKR